MALKGYDLFVHEPGTVQAHVCRVCGTECEVTRRVHGPTGFVMAMGRLASWHDLFRCPHADLGWHEAALKLAVAIDDSPSHRMRLLMRRDLKDVLEHRSRYRSQ